jgi:hypothetical protein
MEKGHFCYRVGMPKRINKSPNKGQEVLLSRRQVAQRWGVCTEAVKRREREDLLRAVRFNGRLIRYRLSEIQEIETVIEAASFLQCLTCLIPTTYKQKTLPGPSLIA